MNQQEYVKKVVKVLDSLRPDIQSKLDRSLEHTPDPTESIEIYIFVDQDGEGFLDIRVSLSGQDQYLLNKSISDYADLVETKMGSEGLIPPFPMLDPFDLEFDSCDVLTDTAIDWLSKNLDFSTCSIAASIVSPEGYGSLSPYPLTLSPHSK